MSRVMHAIIIIMSLSLVSRFQNIFLRIIFLRFFLTLTLHNCILYIRGCHFQRRGEVKSTSSFYFYILISIIILNVIINNYYVCIQAPSSLCNE